MTIDDARRAQKNLPLQQYNAFILYADEDFDFANNVMEKVENSFGLKVKIVHKQCAIFDENFSPQLCVMDRDILGGSTFQHDIVRNLLMTSRCERLIVILSSDFMASPLNLYLTNLAQSLGIEEKERKIIPLAKKRLTKLPNIFFGMHILIHERSQNFWDSLEQSMQSSRYVMILLMIELLGAR